MKKWLFFLKRVANIFPALFMVVTLGFLVTHLAPGDPFSSEGLMSETTIANLNKRYGLDQPLYKQYFLYFINLFRGDLGRSLHHSDRTVSQIIAESFPVSLVLALSSLSVAIVMGSCLGIFSAVSKNSWIDYLCSGVAIIGISLPLFVIAPLLVFFFSMKWHLVPTSGWIFEGFSRSILPIVSLSFPATAVIARLMRASVIGVLNSDYIRTAKAKGLSHRVIIMKHALPGSFLPIVSYLGPMMAGLMTGSLVIEQIFRIPGIARPFIQSALSRDYPVIMGCVITYAVLLMVLNLVVDILYTLLDPRISYDGKR